MIVVGHRITKAKYVTTLWSGEGARAAGGRWNSKGIAMVYTGQSLSLSARNNWYT